MRQIYTSPRPENIDRVLALMAEHGIETSVTNRSNWNRPSYNRFSYTRSAESRDSWPQIWISRSDDFARARDVLREVGIEPVARHTEDFVLASKPVTIDARRKQTVTRVRRIVLMSIAGVFLVLMLRFFNLI